MIYGTRSTYKDVMRPLEPHEANLHCLRSIKYNPKKKSNAQTIFGGKNSTLCLRRKPQHFFRSTGRDRGGSFLTQATFKSELSETYQPHSDFDNLKLNSISDSMSDGQKLSVK